MRLYRLIQTRHTRTSLSGEGGLVADGRWHSAGRRVVYCATSEALAVLEVRVHVGRFIPRHRYTMQVIDVPDGRIAALPEADLPERWNSVPHTDASQRLGDRWLAETSSVALRVPSVHSRSDANVLLNPSHRDFHRVRLIDSVPYRFDARLF